MNDLNTAVAAAVAAALAGLHQQPVKRTRGKSKKASGPRQKLSDEQKTVNAAANAESAVKLFQEAGYENCVAHETILTYGKWEALGRRVKKGQKALRTAKGPALFHRDQTEEIAKPN